MTNILIIGQKSFVAKNFIFDFKDKFNFFYFQRYFKKNNKNYSIILENFIRNNKIKLILNFAGNNDNSFVNKNFEKILVSNFYLPITLLKLSDKLKIPLFLFLSKDMNNNNLLKNFYSISKNMLKSFIYNNNFKCKLRILNLDSLYGPYDLNYNRIFPSIFYNIYNKKKKKTNLYQIKNFTYVKDLNKILYKLIYKKDHFIYKNIKSDKINITKVYKLLIKNKNIDLKKKRIQYRSLFLTSEWYKKYYGKK